MPVETSFPDVFSDMERFARARAETAALEATKIAARRAVVRIRDEMKNAGLGRLGNALGNSSDLEKRGTVYRRGEGFSASGVVFIRAKSERSGANFAPKIFAAMPESRKIGKERLAAAMDRLFRLGRIERAELWKGADRKWIPGLRETPNGESAENG